jgi:predicted MFS family arabinose efflux permease
MTAVFGLLVGLDRGSNVSWNDRYTIAGLCATPLFIVFVFVERYVASHPVAPLRIILNRTLFACYLCNFFSFAGYMSALFYIPLYFQVIGEKSSAQAGLLLLPMIFAGVSGSLFAGTYMKKTGKYYWLTVIAYTSFAIGLAVVFLFEGVVTANIPVMALGTIIMAFSNG